MKKINELKNFLRPLFKAFGAKSAIALFLLLATLLPAAAQNGNFDYFAVPKTIQLTPMTALYQAGTTPLLTTNIANISRFEGILSLDIASCSNGVWGTVNDLAAGYATTNSIAVYLSNTGTNGWSPITNAFLATATTLIISNYWGTTNSQVLYTTNNYQVPGILTYATPSINGFSGQYVVAAQPTNTPSFTDLVGGNNWMLGVSPDGTQGQFVGNNGTAQYIEIVYTVTGSNAVYTVAATLRGRTITGQY